jgi:hypothetical protein
MYDYLRQRVRLPGENKYLLHDVNFDTGTLLESAPEIENVGENRLAGEIDLNMVLMEGVDAAIMETPVPTLEEIIVPEDLNMKVPVDGPR